MMEKKVNFKDSYLLLHSVEAEKLYKSLEESGLLWETISTIFNMHATSKDVLDEVATKKDIELLRADIRQLSLFQNTGTSGSLTPSPSYTPEVSRSYSDEELEERPVKKVLRRRTSEPIDSETMIRRAQKLKEKGEL